MSVVVDGAGGLWNPHHYCHDRQGNMLYAWSQLHSAWWGCCGPGGLLKGVLG